MSRRQTPTTHRFEIESCDDLEKKKKKLMDDTIDHCPHDEGL